LFVCWFSVWRLSTANNCDKRHTENQQTNICGQRSYSKSKDKQLWTNATQKINRQTTVDKRHTENQQTNNCGQTPHRKPIDKQLCKNVTQKINRERSVHSCLSFIPFLVGFVST
jgi:uncharacterized protein YecT (DUF1311 family)